MKIAILGGAGAMGAMIGAHLSAAGNDVTLVDVSESAVTAIGTNGVKIEDKSGAARTTPVAATTKPADVGLVDLVIVFVKCYHTEAAIRSAEPLLGPNTSVLTLQNGWGNAPRIAEMVGSERVLVGVTYHSATVLGPGHVLHAGRGMTFVGELDGSETDRLRAIAAEWRKAELDVTVSTSVLNEIWSKLSLNVCTLPTSALLRLTADQLGAHDGTLALMKALLAEVVAVAKAQGISLSFDERWEAITGVLQRAIGARSSMLQDVDNRRRTEIDVINGAIAAAGIKHGIPTPYNDSMVWLVKSLEETFSA